MHTVQSVLYCVAAITALPAWLQPALSLRKPVQIKTQREAKI